MKKQFLQKIISLLVVTLCLVATIQAQTKIGPPAGAPNANAMLEVSSTNKGLLLPRLALVQTTNPAPLTAHVAGMFVYNTATANDVTPGIYYNDGTQWAQGKFATCQGFGTPSVSGTQPTPANTSTKILFTSEDYDIGNVFTPATGTFTVQQAGRYIITGAAVSQNTTAFTVTQGLSIFKNNVEIVRGTNAFATPSEGKGNVVSYIADLAVGDAIDVRIFNTATLSIFQASFSAVKVDCGAAGTGGVTASAPLTGDGTVGMPLAILNNSFWETDGNTGTVAATNFIGTTDAVDFVTRTNSLERMRVTSGGNVGIGLSSPADKVDVVGGSVGVRDDQQGFKLGGLTTMGLYRNVGDVAATQNDISLRSNAAIVLAGDANNNQGGLFNDGAIVFGIGGPSFSSPTFQERMRLHGNGALGIGTNNPTALLDVVGTARVRTLNAGANTDEVVTADANGVLRKLPASTFGTPITASNGLTLASGDVKLGGTLTQATDVALASNNLTFSGTGNVGIGTTALLHKLTVNTTINDELGIGSTINDQRRIFMTPQISSGAYSGLSVLGDAGIFFASSTGNIITSPTTRGLVIAPWSGAPTGLKITEQGNVGIGTNAPLAPLHVIGGTTINASSNITFFNANAAGLSTNGPGPNTVGILANGNIWSQSFIVAGGGTITASDERIKNIIGLSNNAQDLRLLRQIEVTDYTMKNIVQFGNKQFKKVIAQQVERVYPQIITTQTDYIPNIYSMATEVSINGNTVTLKTATAHDFKNGDWIRLYNKASVALDVQVSAISGNAFTVNINNPEKQYFIYGKKVEDFRTVDYEALSMLNVSATQELAKQVEVLKAAVSTLETENTALRAQATTGVSRAEYNELKAMVAQLLAQKSAAATTATTDEKK